MNATSWHVLIFIQREKTQRYFEEKILHTKNSAMNYQLPKIKAYEILSKMMYETSSRIADNINLRPHMEQIQIHF